MQTHSLFFTMVCFLPNELFWLVGSKMNEEKTFPLSASETQRELKLSQVTREYVQ